MINLFLSNLYFWIWYQSHLTSTFDPHGFFQEPRKYSTSTSKIYDIIGVINFPFICICLCIFLCICIFVQIWIANIISFQKYKVWGVPEAWQQCYSSSMNSGKIVAGREGTGKLKVLQEVLADLKMTISSPSLKSALIVSQVLARNHEHFMHVKIINLGGGLGIDYTHKGLAPR